jgi:hypothetical protein
MGTTTNRGSEYVQSEARSILPEFEIECAQDFDTKDYIVWLTKQGRSRQIRLTMEEVADQDWRALLTSQADAISSEWD